VPSTLLTGCTLRARKCDRAGCSAC
jgi:hypothetical protein